MDNNINLIEEPNTTIVNDKKNKPVKKERIFFWFRLLIDTKKEVNVFQIKRNKLVFTLTNIRLLLAYIVLPLILIAEIIIISINVDTLVKILLPITTTLLSLAFWRHKYFYYSHMVSFKEASDFSFLIHAKYLVAKFMYFYKIDLNDFVTKKISNPDYDAFLASKIEYLKTKDISKLVIIDNIKNSGRICKIYAKDKEKAIRLMKLNLNCFYILAKYSSSYLFAFSILFIVIGIIYVPILLIQTF